MKHISHSEACTYWECQKKWYLKYVKGFRLSSIHLEFGSMAHQVLETRIIPDEILYPELKQAFNISSWNDYFNNIFTTLDELLKDYDVLAKELKLEYNKIVGVIDLVLKHKETGKIMLFDYKFKSVPMSYEDLFLDEQLKIYAKLYSQHAWEDIDNIYVGYINIPKSEISKPKVLKNGTISKDKSQNTTKKLYLETIKELGLNEEDYVDILSELENKKYITIIQSSVDEESINKVVANLHNTLKSIESGFILESMSQNICKNCDYKDLCKK